MSEQKKILSEEEYRQMEKDLNSKVGGGKFFCDHDFKIVVNEQWVHVRFKGKFGEKVERMFVLGLHKCIHCGKGKRDFDIPRDDHLF